MEARHAITTRTVPLDLVAADAPKSLAEATADRDVGVVINDAGLASRPCTLIAPVAEMVMREKVPESAR